MKKIKTNTVILFMILMVLPTSGMHVLNEICASTNQASPHFHSVTNQNNIEQFNVTLWIRDWENKTSYGNLDVTIYDLKERISSRCFPNGTGHIDLLFLNAGSYVISVQTGNRTVGYQQINVAENGTHLIRTWAYDLNMTLVDAQGERLSNHTVFLYDQMVFQAPNYTMMISTIKRSENYTIITDELGSLARQSETDENGTLSFSGVWNGTFRLGIVGKEKWIKKYILGELVWFRQEPATGEHVMDLQEPTNITLTCNRVDLQLHFVSGSNVSMKNATVYTRDMQGHLLFKDCTNETGFVEHRNLYAIDGAYSVSARYGNRTVSRKLIEVNKTEVITVKCWTNNLTVICIDQDDQFLADYVVLLYDQLVFYSPTNVTAVTNQTGLLVNWTKTDENGTACFSDIWNGTYWIRITSGEIVKEAIIDIQGTKFLIMFCDRAYVALRFTTLSGRTLPGATVFLFDEVGSLIFRGHADTDGHIIREGLRLANYTINVVWMGTQVWYGSVDISKERDKTISCMIYRLTLHCVDAFGNSLPRADVTLVKLGSRGERLVLELETDETGSLSLLLPYGSYAVSCSYGIYDGLRMIDLNDDFGLIVTCNVKNIFWVSITAVVVPLVVFTLLLERRKLRTPLEIRKYKTMLSKLESMYRNGLVEYKIYRKLREEYDANIMELGGREMR